MRQQLIERGLCLAHFPLTDKAGRDARHLCQRAQRVAMRIPRQTDLGAKLSIERLVAFTACALLFSELRFMRSIVLALTCQSLIPMGIIISEGIGFYLFGIFFPVALSLLADRVLMLGGIFARDLDRALVRLGAAVAEEDAALAVFNLSMQALASLDAGRRTVIRLDLAPSCKEEELRQFLASRSGLAPEEQIRALIPEKLLPSVISLSKSSDLPHALKCFDVRVTGSRPITQAQQREAVT